MKKFFTLVVFCLVCYSVSFATEEDCGCDGENGVVESEEVVNDKYYDQLVEDGLIEPNDTEDKKDDEQAKDNTTGSENK